jgi:hypothetical protein
MRLNPGGRRLLTVGFALAVALTCAASAGASDPTPGTGPLYIAIGDSIAAGQGLGDDLSPGCKRSRAGYPAMVAQRLIGAGYTDGWSYDYDLACAGATAAAVKGQAYDARDLITAHTGTTPATARPGVVAYVSANAGINDFAFGSATTAKHMMCDSRSNAGNWIRVVLGNVARQVIGDPSTTDSTPGIDSTSLLGAVMANARATIVLHGYYDPIVPGSPLLTGWASTAACAADGLTASQRADRAVRRAAYLFDQLNRSLQDVVASANSTDPFRTPSYDRARFVTPADAFAGHISCTSPDSFVQPLPPDGVSVEGADCAHPSQAGAAAIAGVVSDALQSDQDTVHHIQGSPAPSA